MEKQLRKKYILTKQHWILIILFLIPVILSLLAIYFIFGNFSDAFRKMLELRGKPSRTADAVTSLSYVGTILLAVYSIITTSIFSYLVWKVSAGSFQVSKELKNLEENRDKEVVREHALIVYYDLQRGFSYLRNLYISAVKKDDSPNPNRLFFSSDWIKNVATLRKGLSKEDINIVYRMYNDFFILQSLLENPMKNSSNQNTELIQVIREMSKRYFADFFPLPLLDQYTTSSIDDFLEINHYIILQKIHLLTFTESEVVKKKTGVESFDLSINNVLFYSSHKGELLNGEGVLYTQSGYEKASGYFTKGLFRTGIVYGYFESMTRYYTINYETTGPLRKIIYGELIDSKGTGHEQFYFKGKFEDGKILKGITTTFHSNDSVHYRGNGVNGIKEGDGSTYNQNGKILFKGKYLNGRPHQGTLYHRGNKCFVGEFMDGHPWNGKMTEYDLYEEKIKMFTGIIKDGRPYSGSGIRYKRNEFGEDLECKIYQENWEPDDDMLDYQDDAYQEDLNRQIRDDYSNWEDYIKVDWNEGKAQEREDVERNLTVYYNENSRRKK